MEDSDRDALRSNHRLVVHTLDLENTTILDELIEEDIISSGEQEYILAHKTSRDQNTSFLTILTRKSTSRRPFDSFVKAISRDYDFLAETLIKAKSNRNDSHIQGKTLKTKFNCTHCMLMQNLDPNDISHVLFENGFISIDMLEEINNRNVSRTDRVLKLIGLLKTREDKEFTYDCFRESLKRKYDYLYTDSNPHGFDIYTSCRCTQLKECHAVNKTVEEKEKSPNSVIDGDLARTENAKPPETCSLLYRNVQKCLPNDKRLLRLCNQVWRSLFLLREGGDWEKYDAVTQKAFKCFHRNPDIQVIILRSTMTVSSVYKVDYRKAIDVFTEAMALLPKTKMANWHQVSLLALKTELCTRRSKLEEARHSLEQARQSMCTLAPCIGTGAVNLCEAFYLADLLSFTKSGTKSGSLKEKAKSCFLTAIEHYKEEKHFDLKSLSNQVCLYLALFSLEIDFKKVKYIGGKNVSDADVTLAEHYLNMFENLCWDESTHWSRMLFFIARAEQHKQRSNLQRCIDYLVEAKTWACKGKFDAQLQSLDKYMSHVREKHEEKLHLREVRKRDEEIKFLQLLEHSESYTSSE